MNRCLVNGFGCTVISLAALLAACGDDAGTASATEAASTSAGPSTGDPSTGNPTTSSASDTV
ncbi:MAG: hypothetical protein JNK56_30270, partial [Myxococcales bacterium]|nr:hypothetical protein [Myxococcales bacterium]